MKYQVHQSSAALSFVGDVQIKPMNISDNLLFFEQIEFS